MVVPCAETGLYVGQVVPGSRDSTAAAASTGGEGRWAQASLSKMPWSCVAPNVHFIFFSNLFRLLMASAHDVHTTWADVDGFSVFKGILVAIIMSNNCTTVVYGSSTSSSRQSVASNLKEKCNCCRCRGDTR